MTYLGDVLVTQTVTHRFYTEDATGAPITLAGSPAAQVRKGSGAGSVITTGVTLTPDVVLGQHVVDVVLPASASYTAGAEYSIELSAGTVNGVSVVGKVLASFSIESRSTSAIKAIVDKLDDTVEDDAGTYRFTTNALEQAPTGGGAADGSGFTAIPWNTAWDAEVQSEAADALTAYDPPTKAELDSAVAPLAAVGSAMTLTSGERNAIAAALLDLANAVETGVTLRGAQRLMLAALAGKLSGADTSTTTIRNAVADSKNRIIATTDVTGRTAITADMT